MKKRVWILAVVGLTLLAAGGTAGAADYYIYKDAAGQTVIGNCTPPATAEIIKRYDWSDSTDAEIEQTARDNRRVEARNLERGRIAAAEQLATAIAEANAVARAPVEAKDFSPVQISVSDGAVLRRLDSRLHMSAARLPSVGQAAQAAQAGRGRR